MVNLIANRPTTRYSLHKDIQKQLRKSLKYNPLRLEIIIILIFSECLQFLLLYPVFKHLTNLLGKTSKLKLEFSERILRLKQIPHRFKLYQEIIP